VPQPTARQRTAHRPTTGQPATRPPTAEFAGGGAASEYFDRVLVDAPCSGLGVLRRNPELRAHVTPSDVARLAALQRDILERFAVFVRPGGRLIYATCSILPDENEAIVDAFRRAHPDFTPVPAKEILGSVRAAAIGDGHVLRLLPHRHGTDGFFAAVLRRSARVAGGESA
jgi:16S rRNA (cytosine967-C5)-methyltransferase